MAARTPERDELLARHAAACDYNTCAVDDAVVEEHLRAYLQALGVDRHVARLRVGWDLSEHPSLSRYVARVLDDFKKRNPQERERARSRRDAQDAQVARALRTLGPRSGRSGTLRSLRKLRTLRGDRCISSHPGAFRLAGGDGGGGISRGSPRHCLVRCSCDMQMLSVGRARCSKRSLLARGFFTGPTTRCIGSRSRRCIVTRPLMSVASIARMALRSSRTARICTSGTASWCRRSSSSGQTGSRVSTFRLRPTPKYGASCWSGTASSVT